MPCFQLVLLSPWTSPSAEKSNPQAFQRLIYRLHPSYGFQLKKYWYANYYAKMWSRKLTWALWWVHSYLHWVCPSKHKGSRFWQGCPPRWSCKRQKTSLGKSAPTLIWSIFQYRHLTSLVSSFLNLAAAGLTFGHFSSSSRVWPFSSTEVGGF